MWRKKWFIIIAKKTSICSQQSATPPASSTEKSTRWHWIISGAIKTPVNKQEKWKCWRCATRLWIRHVTKRERLPSRMIWRNHDAFQPIAKLNGIPNKHEIWSRMTLVECKPILFPLSCTACSDVWYFFYFPFLEIENWFYFDGIPSETTLPRFRNFRYASDFFPSHQAKLVIGKTNLPPMGV